jgi:hypothetical protein
MPRWLLWIIAIIFVIWVFSNPAQAGHDVRDWIGSLFSFGQAASG